MTSARNKKLAAKYGGRVLPYRRLTTPAQLAIAHYMAVDGDAWPLPTEWSVQKIKRNLRKLLSNFRSKYGHVKFGYVVLPMKELAKAIMKDIANAGELKNWKTFDDFHNWSVKREPLPRHSRRDRWPVILSGHNNETMQDGWHRLHDYYRQGAAEVPAVYYP